MCVINLQVIQQIHSAGGGGECGGHISHLTGGSPGHSDWEVGTAAIHSETVCVYVCCVCVITLYHHFYFLYPWFTLFLGFVQTAISYEMKGLGLKPRGRLVT